MEDTLKTRSDISVILLFFTGLTILGVLGAAFIVNDYARARASVAWPGYDGVILSQREDGDALRYVYSVEGHSYEGTRLKFFTANFSSKTFPEFGPGETVRVYVDPKDHSVAVLQPGGGGAFFAVASLICGAAVFFGVGGIVRTLTLAAPGGESVNSETG